MRDLEKRRRVMQRSRALGHCICSPKQPCPCEEFKEYNVCHCAGERREVTQNAVPLTQMIENPGCASKINQASLKRVLSTLPAPDDPNVIVGMPAGDDAGVYRLSDSQALVQTVDVFCPSVDDPYTFGQIAAANSLSDVYAMGGRPLTALSVIGYPIHEAPGEVMREILRGGIDTMKEAGVPVIGGHSINDPEVKAGFAVTGVIDPEKTVTNAGVQVGDALVLTKPLGTGITAFAGQIGRAGEGAIAAAAASMAALNRTASELMVECGAHACTDVTGFGLVGHLSEMARSSGVDVEVTWDDVPFLEGVLECVAEGILPGGIERNRESSEEAVVAAEAVTREMLDILFDAQTSGGLLVALPGAKAQDFVNRLHRAGIATAAIIGFAKGKGTGRVLVGTNGSRTIPKPSPRERSAATAVPGETDQAPCCTGAPAEEEVSCCSSSSPAEEEVPCCAEGATVATTAGVESTENAFREFMRRADTPGALDVATKQAIAIALSVLSKCEPCVKTHVAKARKMGLTTEEIDEAAWLAISFGGSPVMMFYQDIKKP